MDIPEFINSFMEEGQQVATPGLFSFLGGCREIIIRVDTNVCMGVCMNKCLEIELLVYKVNCCLT